LRLPIYDTQCGAKLFRVSDELRRVLAEPFISRWIFDIEMIARYISGRRGTDKRPVRETIYEMPLMRWDDVKGSKLKPVDFFTVGLDLLRIWRRMDSDDSTRQWTQNREQTEVASESANVKDSPWREADMNE